MQKAKAITSDIVENTYTQKIILKVLISLLLIVFFVYIYFIGSITFNVLARRSLENNLKVLDGEVSQLEIAYLNKTNEINKNYVLSLGFVENEPDIFVTRSFSDRVAVR